MKLSRREIFLLPVLFMITMFFTNVQGSSALTEKDPFKSLGIPDLNPKALLSELDEESNRKEKKEKGSGLPQLKSIEDLPKFLKSSNLNEEEGVKVLTRFLIQDDFTLKKYGVVYDQSGFDGINSGERIAPIGTEDRLVQRARSAGNIWVSIFRKFFSLKKNSKIWITMPMVPRILWMK